MPEQIEKWRNRIAYDGSQGHYTVDRIVTQLLAIFQPRSTGTA